MNATARSLYKGSRRRGAAVAGQRRGRLIVKNEGRCKTPLAHREEAIEASRNTRPNRRAATSRTTTAVGGAKVDAEKDGAAPLAIACQSGRRRRRAAVTSTKWNDGCSSTTAQQSTRRRRTAQRRCTSPARKARSMRRCCCWRAARRGRSGDEERRDAAMGCLRERPGRRGAAVAGQRRGGRPGRWVVHGLPQGHVDVARLLLDKGAAVASSKNGRTPLLGCRGADVAGQRRGGRSGD